MAKGKSSYHHLQDGEWFRPTMKNFRDQCCDCGLVHKTDFRIVDGHVEFRVFRDGPATGGARKHKGTI